MRTILYSPYYINKTLIWSALKRSSAHLGGKILDVGCGTRQYRDLLSASSHYIGVDENINTKPDVVSKAEEIPFCNECFDSLLCIEVLEHLPEPEAAVKEMRRVLKKSGYIFISAPQTWPLHYEPYDFWRFTKFGLQRLMKKNDFEIINIERMGGICSLIGQRLIDVFWKLSVRGLKVFCGQHWAERVASLLIIPASLFFYLAGAFADRIERSEAIGWALLARKN